MSKPKTKRIRMVVEINCPVWLNPIDARREVRTLVNQQNFFGHGHVAPNAPPRWREIGPENFRAISVRPIGSVRP